jgi:Transposase DDE domain group 1
MGVFKQPFCGFGGTQQVSITKEKENQLGRVGKFHVCPRGDVLSSHAGLLLVKGFVEQLQVGPLLDEQLHVKVRERGYRESEAILGLVYNQVSGGACLSDLEVLRGDVGTLALLEMESLLAPTTAGEWLRKFDMGDIHDLQRVNRLLQERARVLQGQAGQALDTVTIDLDSSIYEQASDRKQGSCKAYNGEVGYHPLLAFWAETEELLCSHLRRGNAHTARRAVWFLKQTLQRVPPGKAKKLRTDSGFYAWAVVEFCEQQQITFAITADQTAPLLARIEALAEAAWTDLEPYGVRQVAQLRYLPTGWKRTYRADYRYVVKRELVQSKKGELSFRYHVMVTNNEVDAPIEVLEWHLQHATMENWIKEHKSGFGLEKLPTQCFHANWAYLLIGQIAYNLAVWFKRLVLPPRYHRATIKTIRHHLLNLAGKVVRTGRQCFLIFSEQYRYAQVWRYAIQRLSTLQPA